MRDIPRQTRSINGPVRAKRSRARTARGSGTYLCHRYAMPTAASVMRSARGTGGLLDLAALEVEARERGVAAEHHASGLGEVDNERLMAGRVPGRRDHLKPGRETRAARDGQIGELGDVPVHAREVRLSFGER